MKENPALSIILPVLDETDTLNRIIAHLREIASADVVELIVVDGDPGGSTINAIKVDGVQRVVSEPGRALQMNRGAAIATGGILLFLHADTFLPANAIALIRAALNDDNIVAGAFDLGFNTRRMIYKVAETYVFLRTRLTRIPFGDQAIFIRGAYFEKIGGYTEVPLMEDVDLMKRIRKRGDRIRIIPAKVRTSPRRYEQEGIVYCTLRNWMLQMLYALGVSPARLVKWYKS